MNYFMGIDPGISGGCAFVSDDRSKYFAFGFKTMTPTDIVTELETMKSMFEIKFAHIELVHSMPKQGVASTFAFGKSFGMLIGILTALKIPFDYVRPVTWQNHMKCRTGGDKNVSKSMAQRLFPETKITHYTADALLIAEFSRQINH